jgi:heme-degrading monooxygenase HmoA
MLFVPSRFILLGGKERQLILEIAQIDVKEGTQAAFERGVAQSRELFLRAKGCLGVELRKSIEFPGRYRLLVQWENLEDHTITFRNSAEFAVWRNHVQRYFAGPPAVEHHEAVALE